MLNVVVVVVVVIVRHVSNTTAMDGEGSRRNKVSDYRFRLQQLLGDGICSGDGDDREAHGVARVAG